MTKELSVIIPSYNTGDYICDAIESIINDVPDCEILVVDDASTDETIENLQQMNIENLSIVQLEENTPGGAGIPSNIGIEKAQGKYIAFVDSDDFFYRGYLSSLLEQIKKTEADICVGYYTLADTVTHIERKGFGYHEWRRCLNDRPSLFDKTHYFRLTPEPWRKVYRADLFKNVLIRFPKNGWVNEDYPFHWYCGLATVRGITYCDIDTYFHRVARSGQTTASFDKRAFSLFDHTREILAFMQSDPTYQFYRGHLLYWLILASRRLKRVKARRDEFYNNYKELLDLFTPEDVSRFTGIAARYHRSMYTTITDSDSLDGFLATLEWNNESK